MLDTAFGLPHQLPEAGLQLQRPFKGIGSIEAQTELTRCSIVVKAPIVKAWQCILPRPQVLCYKLVHLISHVGNQTQYQTSITDVNLE